MTEVLKGIAVHGISLALASLLGFMLGTSETAAIKAKLGIIETKVNEIATHNDKGDVFTSCVRLRLEMLERGVKERPECAAMIDPQ